MKKGQGLHMLLLMEGGNKWKWLRPIGAKCMNQIPLCAVEKSLSFVKESQTISWHPVYPEWGGGSETPSHLLSSRWVFISADFHRKMLCSEWEFVLDTILQKKLSFIQPKCIKRRAFVSLQLRRTCKPPQIWARSIYALFRWHRRLWSSLFSRVMSAFVTPGGRAGSANKKLMNACHSPAKTTPPAPTFSTATSRCTQASGRRPRPHLRIRHLINAARGAICPSSGGRDNELQMAGEINESINGSQHEKVPGDLWVIGGEREKKEEVCVYASANPHPHTPSLPLGRRENHFRWKSWGWGVGWDEKERKADGLAVLGYSLPPSGMFARLKRHFRHAPPHLHHQLSFSLCLACIYFHLIPARCSDHMCPTFSCLGSQRCSDLWLNWPVSDLLVPHGDVGTRSGVNARQRSSFSTRRKIFPVHHLNKNINMGSFTLSLPLRSCLALYF